MRRTLLLLFVAAGLATPSPAAAARSYTIDVARFSVSSIGDFRPSSDPHIGAAERVFGRASSKRKTSGLSCRVRWKRLGLAIVFVSFGDPGASCRDDVGRAQTFKARGKRFRTWHGLRVGQPEASVTRRHPAAEFRAGAWWLKTAISPFGDGETEFAVVDARIGRDDRVRVLRGWIGAAGD